MNRFLIALLPLLAAANAGIYSARWPEGEVDATLILRSGHVGLQGVDSPAHNAGYVPIMPGELRTDLEDESLDIKVKADDKPKPEPVVEKEKIDEVDQANTAQVELRSDLSYVNIGAMQNRPPNAWRQTWQYQPKRVRSIQVQDTDAKPTGIVESPEAPISTARTPELETVKEEKPEILAPVTDAKLENPEKVAENEKQLRYGYLIPTYNYYNRNPALLVSPSYQSASAVAQNAPGANIAASSANNQGFGNGAATSQAVNSGAFQSAVSNANNYHGSSTAAAQNFGGQSSSVAQAVNNRGPIRYWAPKYQSATAIATNQ